ncbi:LD-carboxypeptidase [Thermodesulfobacteriota bacterium]
MNIIPERLRQGDTIGLVAPAGPVTPEEIQPTIRMLKDRGFSVMEGANLYKNQEYLAGSDEERLHDLHFMFHQDHVKALFCVRGGYGTPRLLEKIDYDLIKKNPRIIAGYSDITALMLAIHKVTGLVVFHGQMARGVTDVEDRNINSLLELLSSDGNIKIELNVEHVLRGGKARGKLLGGNLSLISSLAGTPYLPSLNGNILLIEDRGEPLYRIDRMLTQLKLNGLLDNPGGVIIGNFIDCGDILDINRLVISFIPDGCPVYSGFPIGHGDENRAIPIGAGAVLDTDELSLSFTRACVK